MSDFNFDTSVNIVRMLATEAGVEHVPDWQKRENEEALSRAVSALHKQGHLEDVLSKIPMCPDKNRVDTQLPCVGRIDVDAAGEPRSLLFYTSTAEIVTAGRSELSNPAHATVAPISESQ